MIASSFERAPSKTSKQEHAKQTLKFNMGEMKNILSQACSSSALKQHTTIKGTAAAIAFSNSARCEDNI
jgi:hypothetical protein